ncbi:uncharacterized protein LOC141858369 [Brevipalpus obovatus]|uniref:uncharacterized protein LOC141858369 n=1 Tax=Brevipalpus obovatus TaxID=246614 RepID=UPI003D9F9457
MNMYFSRIFCWFSCIWFAISEKVSSSFLELNDLESNQRQLATEGFSQLLWNNVQQSDRRPELISKKCWNDLKTVVGKRNKASSLFEQLNAWSGKFPKNFEKGHLVDFGDYEACLWSSSLDDQLPRQYCSISTVPDFERLRELNITSADVDRIFGSDYDVPIGRFVEIGICTVASCTAADISTIFQQATRDTFWIYAGSVYCQSKASFVEKIWQASIAQKLSMGLFSLSFLAVMLVGLLELISFTKKSTRNDDRSIFARIFSPSDSLGMLIAPVNPKRLEFFDGMRLFTYVYVFIFHAAFVHLMAGLGALLAKMDALNNLPGEWFFQPISGKFYFSALPFFGGLSAATFLLNREKKILSLTDIFKVLLARFLQYQPIILAAVALEITLPLIGSGPIYSRITEKLSDNCANGFWLNILHISNLPPPSEMCFLPGWTISVEFQLLLIAAPLYYITNRRRNVGKTLTLITSLIGFGYLIHVFLESGIPPIDWRNPLKTADIFTYIVVYYMRTLPHMWVFLWPFFLIILIEDGFHRKLEKSSWKIVTKVCYCLLILTSFTPAYYNIYGSKVESFSTVIFLLINYGMFWITCSAILLRYGDEFLVLLGKQAIVDIEMSPKSGELKDVGRKLMFEEEIKSATRRQTLVPPTWLDVSLRLARPAFFSHMAIIFWYNAQVSEPFQFLSDTWLYHMTMTFIGILTGAIIFQILVFGPMTRAFEVLRKAFQ